jgi:hypothetical protein
VHGERLTELIGAPMEMHNMFLLIMTDLMDNMFMSTKIRIG